jgi:hypothetical protein
MNRRLMLALLVILAVFGAWTAGRAQTNVANFQFTVEAPRGPVKITCERGCDWPAKEGELVCDTERCRWIFTGRGRVLVGQPN